MKRGQFLILVLIFVLISAIPVVLSQTDIFSLGNGRFKVDTNGNIIRVNNVPYSWPGVQGAASTVWTNDGSGNLSWAASTGLVVDDVEFAPQPVASATGNATRAGQTTYEGAAFFLIRPVQFNRVIFRITAHSINGNAKVLIYQATDGKGGNTASLKATISQAITGAAVYVATPSEGTVNLALGRIYILFGKDGGTFTFQTRITQPMNLFTADVDADTAPGEFTTTIATNTNPATFNPKPTPGGEATPTALDVLLMVRLKKI